MSSLENNVSPARKPSRFSGVFATFCLLLVWSNINTGFWFFDLPWDSLFNISLVVRAALPFILPFFFLIFYFRQDWRMRSSVNPAWWLGLYGVIALFSSLFSPEPYAAFYWGMAFLMGLWAPSLFFLRSPSADYAPERIMLYATWGMLAIFVVAMVFLFGASLVEEREILGTANAAGEGFSTRSSGLGRFFGVMGVILAVWLFQGRSIFRFCLILPVLFCLRVVWVAQSRGAMFALLFSLLVVLITSRAKWLTFFITVIGVALSLTLFHAASTQVKVQVVDQFRRGQTRTEFLSMTGRTRAYEKALVEIGKRPFFGAGNWTDRLTIHEHVHNSYLQALLNAGIIGFIPYLLSWIGALQLCFLIYRRQELLSGEQQILFLQSLAVTVFFLIRSIPETTTASFSVDQVVMVPVFYYLTVTYFRLKEKEECLKIPEKSIR